MSKSRLAGQIATLAAFAGTAAAAGVIGNRVDAHIDSVMPLLGKPTPLNTGTSVLVFFLCMVPSAWFIIRYSNALKTTSNIYAIDDLLLTSLHEIYQSSDAINASKRTANLLFQSLIKVKAFDSCGIAIYRPQPDGNYLTTWQQYSTPNEGSSSSLSFFIGDGNSSSSPTSARGIAGTTYLDLSTRVVHIERRATEDVADDSLYLASPSGRVSYRSLICAAMIHRNKAVGVLCLYSSIKDAFDKPEISKLVEGLAVRFTAVVLAEEGITN